MGAMRRSAIAAAAAVSIGLGMGTGAAAAPNPDRKLVITAGCMEAGGDPFSVDVIPLGGMAFVVGDDGEPTGEKLHLLSLDLAGFDQAGHLVFEQHKSYGKRSGQTDVIFCSGSFDAGDGVLAFFDALATRR